MMNLLDRIDVFESKVVQLVENLKNLKSERSILIQENGRLKMEIDQLRRRVDIKEDHRIDSESDDYKLINSNIDPEQLKSDIDNCISDVEECLKMVRQ